MAGYADYCPIATGAQVLGDRWTPLVIRELMIGCTGFNEIHRGIPRVSRTLLSQRLRQLERMGIVERTPGQRGKQGSYRLTPAGEGLTPIVWAMGQWAAEWAFGDPDDEDCDGISLLWRLHQHAIPEKLPARRTVVHVVLTGTNGAQAWLDVGDGNVTMCRDDQGYDVDLALQADTAQMHRWITGHVPFRELVANGDARLLGPSRLARAFPGWFDTSAFGDSIARGRKRGELLSV